MVGLSFSVYAYDFEYVVRGVRRVYDLSTAGLNVQLKAAVDALNEYDQRVADEGEPERLVDKRGWLEPDQRDFLIFDVDAVDEALMNLRKSMVILLFHAWERAARNFAGDPEDNFAALFGKLKDRGVLVDDQVNELRILVNLLKHNSLPKAKALHDKRPDLFKANYDPKEDSEQEWFDNVEISEDAMIGFFNAVEKSGPTHDAE